MKKRLQRLSFGLSCIVALAASPAVAQSDNDPQETVSEQESLTASESAAETSRSPTDSSTEAQAPPPPESVDIALGSGVASATPRPQPIVVGLELGGTFSQLFSRLGSSPTASIELGYLLPIFGYRLQGRIDLTYSQSRYRSTALDPRLSGDGTYVHNTRAQQWAVGMGALYRLHTPGTALNFYGRGALRVEVQRSQSKGRAGVGFGANQQFATEVGIVVGGGAEYRLGPGVLTAELSVNVADMDHLLTGESTSGGPALMLGYRLFL